MSNVTKITVDGTKVTVEHEGEEPSVQNFSEPAHATEYAEAKAADAGIEVTIAGTEPVAESAPEPVAP